MGSGQIPVQYHHVVPGDGQVLERRGPVQDDVDRHALTTQPGGDRRGQVFDVFSDEHSHDLSAILLCCQVTGCQVTGCQVTGCQVTGRELRDLDPTMPGCQYQPGFSGRHRPDTGAGVQPLPEPNIHPVRRRPDERRDHRSQRAARTGPGRPGAVSQGRDHHQGEHPAGIGVRGDAGHRRPRGADAVRLHRRQRRAARHGHGAQEPGVSSWLSTWP